MRQPVRGEVGNVVRLPVGGRPYQAESRPQARAMTEAALSFERLERCAAVLQSGPLGARGELGGGEWPIVSFQVALPVIHQRLEQLGGVSVVSWPDAQWALRLGNARAAALLRLHAVRRSCTAARLAPGRWTAGWRRIYGTLPTRCSGCAD